MSEKGLEFFDHHLGKILDPRHHCKHCEEK
jgi:hypothetical protein